MLKGGSADGRKSERGGRRVWAGRGAPRRAAASAAAGEASLPAEGLIPMDDLASPLHCLRMPSSAGRVPGSARLPRELVILSEHDLGFSEE
eukprot:6374758-Alexandrium_andersonii.AAC.1